MVSPIGPSPRSAAAAPVHRAAGPERRCWLDSALEELDEVARGIEVDGPTPGAEVVAAARKCLRSLSELFASPPGVNDDGTGGIGIEFAGEEGGRILFIIETPRSFACYQLVGGRSTSAQSTSWTQLLRAIGITGSRDLPERRGSAPPRPSAAEKNDLAPSCASSGTPPSGPGLLQSGIQRNQGPGDTG